jgi:hypothetical protein
MLKNYDELIDLIHKNDRKIEAFLNIINKKLIGRYSLEDDNLDNDHLNLTLVLANRQVYENKLYNSVCKETKKEQKQDTKALDLISERMDFVNNQLFEPIMDSFESGLHHAREIEIIFLKRLKNVLSED